MADPRAPHLLREESALRRLAEPSTVLGITPAGTIAVIARRGPFGDVRETGRLSGVLARSFIARGFLVERPGCKVALRYELTSAGRSRLAECVSDRAFARTAARRGPAVAVAPLADRLAAIKLPSGRRALWPADIARAERVRLNRAEAGAVGIVARVAAVRDWRVARIFSALVLGDAPICEVARREGMTPAGCRVALASGVRALGEIGVA